MRRRSPPPSPARPRAAAASETLSCASAVELLPWLCNGSLEVAERRTLEAHLVTCAACRTELAETAEAWQLLSDHVPSLTLAEYAQGLPPSGLDRERIERHLALCPSCRQELEWATVDEGVLDFPIERTRAPAAVERVAVWRRLAVAASFAALSMGGLLWSLVLRPPTEGRDPEITSLPAAAPAETPVGEVTASSLPGELLADGFEQSSTTAWSVTVALRSEGPRPSATVEPEEKPTETPNDPWT